MVSAVDAIRRSLAENRKRSTLGRRQPRAAVSTWAGGLSTGSFAQILPLVYNRSLPMDLAAIQSALRERNIDAWLFYDHHHRDPIAYRVLGLPPSLMVTRRWFYLIPAEGEPVKLVHKIEAGHLDSLP